MSTMTREEVLSGLQGIVEAPSLSDAVKIHERIAPFVKPRADSALGAKVYQQVESVKIATDVVVSSCDELVQSTPLDVVPDLSGAVAYINSVVASVPEISSLVSGASVLAGALTHSKIPEIDYDLIHTLLAYSKIVNQSSFGFVIPFQVNESLLKKLVADNSGFVDHEKWISSFASSVAELSFYVKALPSLGAPAKGNIVATRCIESLKVILAGADPLALVSNLSLRNAELIEQVGLLHADTSLKRNIHYLHGLRRHFSQSGFQKAAVLYDALEERACDAAYECFSKDFDKVKTSEDYSVLFKEAGMRKFYPVLDQLVDFMKNYSVALSLTPDRLKTSADLLAQWFRLNPVNDSLVSAVRDNFDNKYVIRGESLIVAEPLKQVNTAYGVMSAIDSIETIKPLPQSRDELLGWQ